MKQVTIIFMLLFSIQVCSQNDFLTFENALQKSKEESKPLILYFSGSDWCKPSIALQRNVLQTKRFTAFKEEVIFMQLDFPLKYSNRLSRKETNHNENLAVRYNPQDYFPKMILVNYSGELMAEFKYRKGMSPQDFIDQIKKEL